MKKSTKFQKGRSGNPLGRPMGSRNKLSEHFISDLQELWDEQGSEILLRIADEHPEKLLIAMVQVLPRDFQLKISDSRLSISEYSMEELREMLGTIDEQQKLTLID